MLNLFFPQLCCGCDRRLFDNQGVLCTYCLNNLPLLHQKTSKNHQIESLCYGRIELVHSMSLMQFEKKGLSQALLHRLKYYDQQKIGQYFGRLLGNQILDLELQPAIDKIVYVPVSSRTLRKRGYNQVTAFAQELSNVLNIPLNHNVLKKANGSASSVFLGRRERQSKETLFGLSTKAPDLSGKHLLLVDDLVTTGATLEACAKELLKIPEVSLSFASIAVV